MDTLLFSGRSIWTMIHGIVLGGGALLGLSAALFSVRAMGATDAAITVSERQARMLGWLVVLTTALLWLAVVVGTYVTFPPYRATPPEGIADLAAYPKALIQAKPSAAWLHSFAMETKEHVPWITVMLSTAAAFIAVRYRSRTLKDPRLNAMVTKLLAVSFVLVAFVSILGVFVNKVAPLQ